LDNPPRHRDGQSCLPAKLLDEAEHEHGKAGSRAADLEWCSAEDTGYESADRASDKACHDRGAGRQGDTESEWHCYEEHDQ
jgi:hypothetical protein